MTNKTCLMPIEPTKEVLDAIAALFTPGFFDGLMERDIYKAIYETLHAAPVTTQEPVKLPERMFRDKASSLSDYPPEIVMYWWNACLDEVAKLGPLYTHADAGEVERLREQVETFRLMNTDYLVETDRLRAELANTMAECKRRRDCAADLIEERDTLRGQLAEAQALFARIIGKRDACVASFWFDEIGALLSARAKPSAPVERDERAEFERRFPYLDHTLCSHEDWKDQYECPKAGALWNGWQARAALERMS